MKDAAVIEKHGVERIGKRELSQGPTVGRKDLRDSSKWVRELRKNEWMNERG